MYYAVVKRRGKQFRRSLQTSDRQLAIRRLSYFRKRVTRLSENKHAGSLGFEEFAERWLETMQAKASQNPLTRAG